MSNLITSSKKEDNIIINKHLINIIKDYIQYILPYKYELLQTTKGLRLEGEQNKHYNIFYYNDHIIFNETNISRKSKIIAKINNNKGEWYIRYKN